MRFVVLRHVPPRDKPHFDLMLEDSSGLLRTWRCDRLPDAAWQAVTPLSEHRDVYLRYQGPVLGRGWVRRVECGNCRIVADREVVVRAILRSGQGCGVLEIERNRDSPTGWRCRRTQSSMNVNSPMERSRSWEASDDC